MTFEGLIHIVREWQATMAPAQARAATEDWVRGATVALGGLLVPPSIDVEAMLAFADSGKPVEPPDTDRFLRWPPPPPRKPKRRPKAVQAPALPPVIDDVPIAAPAASRLV